MPKNATVNGDGFRMYQWPGGDTPLNREYQTFDDKGRLVSDPTQPSDLLSVTSIRSLAGEPFQLVNWKITNVVNLAMGVRKGVRIGPRGGVYDIYVPDGPHPGEFVTRMVETRGKQAALDDLRQWLRSTADEPRDIAAVRGSVVHKMIEMNIPLSIVNETLVRQRFAVQWAEEKRKVKPVVIEDDVNFVSNAMAQYWDMRAHVPFVILAQEPQVYNLTAGYGGSADALIWFLGHFEADSSFVPLPQRENLEDLQQQANDGKITLADVEAIGGFIAVGDWKTAKGVYTNHVVQTTAYMAGEFIALDGIIDTRLSDLLSAAMVGMVIHVRPDFWNVDIFDFRTDVLQAFLGSVAFARFLAMHKTPYNLFVNSLRGQAPGTEQSKNEVADNE